MIINESEINNTKIKYYSGFDIDMIINHPSDGKNGMLVVFFDSISEEEIKHKRNEKILSLIENKKIKKFDDIFNLDNPYLALWQTNGQTDIVYKLVKNKIEENREFSQHYKVSNNFSVSIH